MIPEVWLDFARERESPLMPLVLSHNAEDVVGLARLVARAQARFDEPLVRGRGVDLAGLGRSLLAAGRLAEGEELLEAAAGEGDEGAGLLLTARYRGSGRIEDCLRVAASLPDSFRGSLELAKVHERLSLDLAQALRWALLARERAGSEAQRKAADSRIARLARKTERSSG
jgi:hypothetical protein